MQNLESQKTSEFMFDNGIEFLSRCKCGAITVTIDGQNYSMAAKTFRRRYGVTRMPRIRQQCFCCDHCVNHWGIDLCACGSGKHYLRCNEGCKECGSPMQMIRLRGDMNAEPGRRRLSTGEVWA